MLEEWMQEGKGRIARNHKFRTKKVRLTADSFGNAVFFVKSSIQIPMTNGDVNCRSVLTTLIATI
jgi:hypothetical protein